MLHVNEGKLNRQADVQDRVGQINQADFYM